MIESGTCQDGLMMHIAHHVGEDRRRRFRFADDDARLVDDRIALHDRDREVRDVDLDPPLAHVARLPAPHLHIGEDRRPLAGKRAERERGVGGGGMDAPAGRPFRRADRVGPAADRAR